MPAVCPDACPVLAMAGPMRDAIKMRDEHGLDMIAHDYRAWRTVNRPNRRDLAWSRWKEFTALQCETPFPRPFHRPWVWGSGRTSLAAPDDAALTASPQIVTRDVRISW